MTRNGGVFPGHRSEKGFAARYAVTSIHGYPIRPHLFEIGKARTEWYVVDRILCYQVVATFNRNRAEEKARQLCHELNVEERRWEKELPDAR